MISFMKKYKLNITQMALLMDCPRTRIQALMNGAKPTEYEQIKLKRLKKIKPLITKPISIEEIVSEQTKSIESNINKIALKVKHSHCVMEDIDEVLEDLKVNSMYLGLLLANNNDDEKVLTEVRKRRNL